MVDKIGQWWKEWIMYKVKGRIATRSGINWQWDYFADEKDAREFAANLHKKGYDGRHRLHQVKAEIPGSWDWETPIPAGSWCVHWHSVWIGKEEE